MKTIAWYDFLFGWCLGHVLGIALVFLLVSACRADDAKTWTVNMTQDLVVDGRPVIDPATHNPADFVRDSNGKYVDNDPLCTHCRPFTIGTYIALALKSVMENEKQTLDMRAREGWSAFAEQIKDGTAVALTAKQIALIESRIDKATIHPGAALAVKRIIDPNYKPLMPE